MDKAPSPHTEDLWWSGEFDKLSPRTRRHLPFLGLFLSGVAIETLESFVGSGDRQQELYIELLGESLDAAGWETTLDEAARGGLLLAVYRGQYELLPAVSTFLRRKLIAAVGPPGLQRLGSEFVQFYAAWAAHLEEAVLHGEEQARRRVALEEPNLRRALRLAAIDGLWRLALPLVRTLKEHDESAGRLDAWQALRAELLAQLGTTVDPAAGRDHAALWFFLQGSVAGDALAQNDLDGAERLYRYLLEVLPSWPDPQAEPYSGVACHQLGLIASERRDLDQAEQWYRRALGIFQNLGLERSMADEYHQLGCVAQSRQQWKEAEQLYRQALAIYERRGLGPYAAAACLQLGRLAESLRQAGPAEGWCLRALALCEPAEHPMLVLQSWILLGGLQEQQGRLPEAVASYGHALDTTTAHPLNLTRQVLLKLSGVLQALGEEAFAAAWRRALPGEPPLAAVRKVLP